MFTKRMYIIFVWGLVCSIQIWEGVFVVCDCVCALIRESQIAMNSKLTFKFRNDWYGIVQSPIDVHVLWTFVNMDLCASVFVFRYLYMCIGIWMYMKALNLYELIRRWPTCSLTLYVTNAHTFLSQDNCGD